MSNNPNACLSPSLAQVIAWVETKNQCNDLRFERATYERLWRGETHSQNLILALARSANRCSDDTARAIYSMSWGKYQIMGFNLYGPEVGYSGTVAQYMNDEAAQDASFVKLATHMGLLNLTPQQLADASALRLHLSLVWNGSAAYNEPLTEALQHFGFTVK